MVWGTTVRRTSYIQWFGALPCAKHYKYTGLVPYCAPNVMDIMGWRKQCPEPLYMQRLAHGRAPNHCIRNVWRATMPQTCVYETFGARQLPMASKGELIDITG